MNSLSSIVFAAAICVLSSLVPPVCRFLLYSSPPSLPSHCSFSCNFYELPHYFKATHYGPPWCGCVAPCSMIGGYSISVAPNSSLPSPPCLNRRACIERDCIAQLTSFDDHWMHNIAHLLTTATSILYLHVSSGMVNLPSSNGKTKSPLTLAVVEMIRPRRGPMVNSN